MLDAPSKSALTLKHNLADSNLTHDLATLRVQVDETARGLKEQPPLDGVFKVARDLISATWELLAYYDVWFLGKIYLHSEKTKSRESALHRIKINPKFWAEFLPNSAAEELQTLQSKVEGLSSCLAEARLHAILSVRPDESVAGATWFMQLIEFDEDRARFTEVLFACAAAEGPHAFFRELVEARLGEYAVYPKECFEQVELIERLLDEPHKINNALYERRFDFEGFYFRLESSSASPLGSLVHGLTGGRARDVRKAREFAVHARSLAQAYAAALESIRAAAGLTTGEPG